jgi:2,4-dienoyl-CoA reductase-like NADH-dependent reductase (Old Yellow Enzyme family)
MGTDRAATLLFSPLMLGAVRLSNRVVIAPMQMYMGKDGAPNDWHHAHLLKFALGGAGLIFTEALAVDPKGRNTYGDLGIWSDDFIAPLRRLADALREAGAVPGAQLFHCGPKASRQRPWEGYGPLGEKEARRGEVPWQPVGPSGVAKVAGWPDPHELTIAEIEALLEAYRQGARRCHAAGFDVINVHAAHGYLIHSFYSPLSNFRTDRYGGDRAGRMRFPLEVAEAVRREWPADKPFFYRLSCVDGDQGWSLDDTVELSQELGKRGVDVIDCSSGGIGLPPTIASVKRRPGYQVPYAERVRRDAKLPTMAVGLILTGRQAEDILQRGQADLIAVARQALFDPHWALHAALELGADPGFEKWPPQYGWWLARRAQTMAQGAS